MYKKPKFSVTKMKVFAVTEGETIEEKIERQVSNKEPIKDGAPLIYTERKEGVRAGTNIRTDRWEVAVEASDKIAKSYQARREERARPKDREPLKKDEKITGGEPAQGKSGADTSQ